MASTLHLQTIPDLAKELHLSERQLEHAVRSRRVVPTGILGGARVFDAEGRARVIAALRETGAIADATAVGVTR